MIPQELSLRLATEGEVWEQARAMVSAYTVDASTYARATELLRQVKTARKEIDDARRGITDPMMLAKRRADEWFRPFLSRLDAIEEELRAKVNAHLAATEAARLAAMRAAEPVPPPPAAPRTHTVRERVYRIVDAAAVPREYCTPDPALLAGTDGTDVPGVEWYTRERVVVR